MARLYYECNLKLKNDSANNAILRPYACTPERHCLYCCCNLQCCFVVQRRPPRHLWETWYFWLGIALVAVFVISSVSSYIVSNYRHNIQGVPFRRNPHVNTNVRNDRVDQPAANRNQISISIIPSTGTLSSQRKTLVIGAQPSVTHMSKGESNVFFPL
ncbi:uncharacterized protein LOC105181968 [Harpegnathos saltator]|uniref:uncharacterized protein LOC105181968 n=1 Tax=Harpegnathos saltator TaxID=610380 RepID=UPI00058EB38B|nr:uncharacterized protein LOC105181968 [Harpegnathos saltator]